MKRQLAGIIVVLLFLGTVTWGQATKEPFDTNKSKQELEIMKGILNTSLKFVAQNSEKRLRFSISSAFYLAGQGAVFMIPTPEFRMSSLTNMPFDANPEFAENMRRLTEQTREIQAEAARFAREALASSTLSALYRGTGSGIGAGTGGATPVPPASPAPAAPPAPPAPPTPPAPPARSEMTEKERDLARQAEEARLRKSVEEAQARVKKLREEAEANREKFLKNLAEIKVYLVEALANYGDSMTTVKPDEYINLVLISDQLDDQGTRSDVISVRKSWITDYKAGRLTLEGFKQKVVQYNQS